MPPDRLPGERRGGRIGKNLLPRAGIQTVRADHQIKAAGTAIGEVDRDERAVVFKAFGGDPQSDRRTRGERPVAQDLVQCASADTNVWGIVRDESR